jgi:Zn finger protein HypA/HybF involved in hydrogenase expression
MPESYYYNGKSLTAKICGVDYYIEQELTCLSCHKVWRLEKAPKLPKCPRCQSSKVCWVSKRSCDEMSSNEVIIPEDSPLL